jgi:hypothetical protein
MQFIKQHVIALLSSAIISMIIGYIFTGIYELSPVHSVLKLAGILAYHLIILILNSIFLLVNYWIKLPSFTFSLLAFVSTILTLLLIYSYDNYTSDRSLKIDIELMSVLISYILSNLFYMFFCNRREHY